jgi:hypothetical protein
MNNKNVKVILFNGPPSSGKDTACKCIADHFEGVRVDKFARILKERTHALYGFPDRDFMYYENSKDIPSKDFLGLTPRQAYINVSEKYFKVFHNKRIFGEMLANDLYNYDFEILTISDSGFVEEANVLIEKYGADNIFLIKIQSLEDSFEEDSRSYINLEGVVEYTITNFKDDKFLLDVRNIVEGIVTPNPIHLNVPVVDSATMGRIQNYPTPMPVTFIEEESIDSNQYKAPVQSDTVFLPEVKAQKDYTSKGEDHVFMDVVTNRPWYKKVWARLSNNYITQKLNNNA